MANTAAAHRAWFDELQELTNFINAIEARTGGTFVKDLAEKAALLWAAAHADKEANPERFAEQVFKVSEGILAAHKRSRESPLSSPDSSTDQTAHAGTRPNSLQR